MHDECYPRCEPLLGDAEIGGEVRSKPRHPAHWRFNVTAGVYGNGHHHCKPNPYSCENCARLFRPWRAQIVLLTADGCDTTEITRRTGKAKTAVWRWHERFMEAGVDGLLRDKTRPSRIPPLAPEIAERVVALTLEPPPGETTHWTALAMAKAVGISVLAPAAPAPAPRSRPRH